MYWNDCGYFPKVSEPFLNRHLIRKSTLLRCQYCPFLWIYFSHSPIPSMLGDSGPPGSVTVPSDVRQKSQEEKKDSLCATPSSLLYFKTAGKVFLIEQTILVVHVTWYVYNPIFKIQNIIWVLFHCAIIMPCVMPKALDNYDAHSLPLL